MRQKRDRKRACRSLVWTINEHVDDYPNGCCRSKRFGTYPHQNRECNPNRAEPADIRQTHILWREKRRAPTSGRPRSFEARDKSW